jgi:hypothetical protein
MAPVTRVAASFEATSTALRMHYAPIKLLRTREDEVAKSQRMGT